MSTSQGPGNSEHSDQLRARLRATFEREEQRFVPPDAGEASMRFRARRDGTVKNAVHQRTSFPKSLDRFPGVSRSWRVQTLRQWGWTGAAMLFALIAALWMRSPTQDFGVTHTYATKVGQRATILLDDGTRVMLAPQTTLQLVRFGRQSRTVVLDGDAYFNVASSSRAPFVVQTGTRTTRVLGTAFEVRQYHDDPELRVSVATGKVVVSSDALHDGLSVVAGQVLSLTDSIPTVKSVDNVDTEIGWLGDQLVFQRVPMAKVLETLTRWYGYKFQYADSSITRQIVTMGLSMQSSTEALSTLEQILDVNLTVVGDTVKLTPVRGRTAPGQRAKRYDVWLPTREVGR